MATSTHEYWQEMKDKAAANIAHVTEWSKPTDEDDLKEHIAYALRSGNSHEKAEVLIEAVEFMTACHMLKTHMMPA